MIRATRHADVKLERIVRVTNSCKRSIRQRWSVHFTATAVDKHHTIGSTEGCSQLLKKREETSITSPSQPPLTGWAGCGRDRVTDPNKMGHLIARDPLLAEFDQGGVVVGCSADVEVIAQRSRTRAGGDVAIDQHEQAHLLDRATQHELNIRTADITLRGGFQALFPFSISTQIRRDMQEKDSDNPWAAAIAINCCITLSSIACSER